MTKLLSMLTRHAPPKEVIENLKISLDEGVQFIGSSQGLNKDHEIRLRPVMDPGSQNILEESSALNETIAKEGM